MHVEIEMFETTIIFHISGKIDGKVSKELQDIILPLIKENNHILLDMSQVDHLSSAGLRVILAVYRQVTQQKSKIALLNVVEEVREIMEVTGFISYFKLFDDKTAALKWLDST